MKIIITAILSSLILSACAVKYPPHNPPTPTGVSPEIQQIAALAFVSYAGDELVNRDIAVDEALQACVAWELKRQPILNDRFSLAWGPGVYRFDFAELDDNMMYAVWDNAKHGHLVIAIRGTNPASISDWLVEDFFVNETVAWAYTDPVNQNARISKATDIGLTALQGITGKNHCTDCGGSILLKDFLLENAQNGKLKSITVTGHSLAGALSPAFALWIHDALFPSKNTPNISIHVLPIAGATAGNAQFAAYYDGILKPTTNRLHNPFDVVPQAWFIPDMRKLDSIYTTDQYAIHPNFLERAAFDLGIELAKDKNYTHINAAQASTGGVINPNALDKHGKLSFATQAGWQHHFGYYNALGMSSKVFNTNSTCLTENYCKQNPTDQQCVALFQVMCQAVP